jgi:hypothetical protein
MYRQNRILSTTWIFEQMKDSNKNISNVPNNVIKLIANKLDIDLEQYKRTNEMYRQKRILSTR